MRTMRSLLVLVVAFAALVYASVTVAMPVITPAPTAMTMPAATYPWVQPVWTSVGAVTLPTVPHTTGATTTQPPAWIAI